MFSVVCVQEHVLLLCRGLVTSPKEVNVKIKLVQFFHVFFIVTAVSIRLWI